MNRTTESTESEQSSQEMQSQERMRSRQGMESRHGMESREEIRGTGGYRSAQTTTPSSWWKERSKIERPGAYEPERSEYEGRRVLEIQAMIRENN